MSLFGRRGKQTGAVRGSARSPFDGTIEELQAEIAALTGENRRTPDVDTERRILHLRHLAGIRLLEPTIQPTFPETDLSLLPPIGEGLPEFSPAEVTPELLRAGMMRDGSVLVRGLVPRSVALAFASKIDEAFEARAGFEDDGKLSPGVYEEFVPEPGVGDVTVRGWVRQGGGVLAADSPSLAFEMQEMFADAGVPELAAGYLGEPALFSVNKTTLRKASPEVAGGWHQDGKFMGPVRALNLWLSLSRCGDVAPGLDVVPRRLDHLVTAATDEAQLDYVVSQSKAEEAAGDRPIVRPVFEPGDALFFDEMNLHKTGSDPSMPNPRFAIENWFFGGSAFPEDYVPVAV
jgi:hypothetical protein